MTLYGGKINRPVSDDAKIALEDLDALGYDIDALMRRNMNNNQIVELRDKAYQYRGIEIPTPSSRRRVDDFVNFFGLGVDLTSKTNREQAKNVARHIFYLAERELSES